MYSNDGFRELERHECLRRLGQALVGRIVSTRQALPAVLPVNFSLGHDGAVLLRTSAASELVRAIDGSVVAFEVGEVDAVAHSGWSVVVTGSAIVVSDSAEHERLTRTGPSSWVPSPEEVFVRVERELVTGRELGGGRSLYGVDLNGADQDLLLAFNPGAIPAGPQIQKGLNLAEGWQGWRVGVPAVALENADQGSRHTHAPCFAIKDCKPRVWTCHWGACRSTCDQT